MKVRNRIAYALIGLTTLASPNISYAVQLSPEGLGQALIYPYYTSQLRGSDPFNTYLSIVNASGDTKAVRVRVREGRNSREVAGFNLFMSPFDVWTGAIGPTDGGALLVTTDNSCTSPQLAPGMGGRTLAFTNANFTGASADGNGETVERLREGWVEVIEMATLTGATADAVKHDVNGVPANCGALQDSNVVATAGAPTGGLSGTLTIINVARGMDFGLNAEALSDLTTRSFYRAATDAYPDFNAAEIDPVSVVSANGFVYRSVWSRGADAVSAVLMRSTWLGEYVVDEGTRSQTDFVTTFPTRQFYVSNGTVADPFHARCAGGDNVLAGEFVQLRAFNREESGGFIGFGFGIYPGAENYRCASSTVFDVNNGRANTAYTSTTQVFASRNRGFLVQGWPRVTDLATGGWIAVIPAITPQPLAGATNRSIVSLPASTRTSVATGVTTAGSHTFTGLPVVGFTARTFENGALSCSTGTCQGNYGSAFPYKYQRNISPTS